MAALDAAQRRTASRALLGAAAGATLLGVVLLWTGGFSARIYGVRISAHGALRPILFALLFAAAGVRLLDPSEQDALIARLLRRSNRLLPATAGIASAAVLVLGIFCGTRSAGGSDSYGYISQSDLWRAGDLRVHQDFVASIPWPNADWSFTPLGYRPSVNHTLVPSYAPGLPLLMVLFTGILGSCGPYLVNPLCGALLVILTYAIGSQVSGRAVGAVAALLVASSPTVLFMTLWPMSDVPAATFWTASLLLSARAAMPRPGAPAPGEWEVAALVAGSGAVAGVAIAIRPNLVPLAVFPAAIAAWPLVRTWPGRAALRLAAFGIACVPFVLFVAWFYDNLYGSPLHSGYGDTGTIFAWDNLRANLARYPLWLWDTQGPLVFLFLLSPLLSADPCPAGRTSRHWCFAFVLAVFACYLWYLPFEAWWFLRFLLPAFPVIFVLAAHVAWSGTRRFGLQTRIVALGVFAVVMVDYGATRAMERDALGIGKGEQKYADVGRFVASRLPVNAIFVAMQHSGSVRYYSGRPTIRYDSLQADWLDRALAHLRSAGYEPYLLLEKWELPLFRQRFAAQKSVAAVDNPPIARHDRDVMIYRTDGISGLGAPNPIPVTSGCR
jgi:hypothetical protein